MHFASSLNFKQYSNMKHLTRSRTIYLCVMFAFYVHKKEYCPVISSIL